MQSFVDKLNEIMKNELISEPLCGKQVERFENVDVIDANIDQLNDMIDQITLFLETSIIENPEQLIKFSLLVSKQQRFLSGATSALKDGKHFSPLDDVWGVEPASFEDVDETLFNRNHFVKIERINKKNETIVDDRYRTTATGAANSQNQVTFGAARSDSGISSTSSIASSNTSTMNLPNIFGAHNTKVQSAHLMPQSTDCSKCWIHLVSYVLATTEVGQTLSERWTYLQKCIHGFTATADNSSTGSKQGRGTKIDSNEGSTNVHVNTDTCTPKKSNGTEHMAKADCDNATMKPPDKKKRRLDLVGIKHFTSNRILLADQALYLDSLNCVLIVPILNVDDVVKWNGEGYNAIVLATKFKLTKEATVSLGPAHEVYRRIEAYSGPLLFATSNDCMEACALLKAMILCVCKSYVTLFPFEFIVENNEKKKEELERGYQELTKDNKNEVSVPQYKEWLSPLNVRLVKFSDRASNTNPAPDPVLLLGRATSNWLKLQNVPILPGCDSDNDDSTTDTSDNVVIYSRAEVATRGWGTDTDMGPQVKEISFVPCVPLDELLSDDEE